jgi:hypothetical protein
VGGSIVCSICVISPKLFAAGNADAITVWHVEGEHLEKRNEIDTKPPFGMISIPNSRLCWESMYSIFIWDYGNAEKTPKTFSHRFSNSISVLQYDPGKKNIFVATSKGHFHIFDSENLEKLESWDIPGKGNTRQAHQISEILWILRTEKGVLFYNPQIRYVSSLCFVLALCLSLSSLPSALAFRSDSPPLPPSTLPHLYLHDSLPLSLYLHYPCAVVQTMTTINSS